MTQHLRPALVLLILFTLLLGLAYPLAMTGVGQALFPHQTNGSLIVREGHVVGSDLIGQGFSRPDYFWDAHRRRGRAMTRARHPAPISDRIRPSSPSAFEQMRRAMGVRATPFPPIC